MVCVHGGLQLMSSYCACLRVCVHWVLVEHREGPANLYRGLTMPLLARSIQMALMFGVYDNARTALDQTNACSGMSPFVLSV
jgi:hypothetical protein